MESGPVVNGNPEKCSLRSTVRKSRAGGGAPEFGKHPEA